MVGMMSWRPSGESRGQIRLWREEPVWGEITLADSLVRMPQETSFAVCMPLFVRR
jgi:hypothetical protein